MSSTIISRTVFVKAAPGTIFELLADPRRHGEIDGSGTVQNARLNAPARLSLGATFGMDMKLGVPYRITNTVVEFEENKRIAWRHFGGHVWRYILEPVDGGTQVTEQFDPTTAKIPLVLTLMKASKNNAIAIEKTLDNLQDLFD
jgi:hypothetical protein